MLGRGTLLQQLTSKTIHSSNLVATFASIDERVIYWDVVKEVMRGTVFAIVGVLLFAPYAHAQVQAAETVITARVMGVRHIVVDRRGNITQIVSNTSEDVAPIAHLDDLLGKQVSISAETERHYREIISRSDMSRAGVVYLREPPLKKFVANLVKVSIFVPKAEI